MVQKIKVLEFFPSPYCNITTLQKFITEAMETAKNNNVKFSYDKERNDFYVIFKRQEGKICELLRGHLYK